MEKGKKYDKGKTDWSLLPLKPIEWIVGVLEHGRAKYNKDNWQKLEDFEDRYFSALMRHFTLYRGGEVYDSDSGYHHLAHIGCNIVFLIWKEIQKNIPLRKGEKSD